MSKLQGRICYPTSAVQMSTSSLHDSEPIYFWRETEPEYGFLSQWFNAPFQAPSPGTDQGHEAMAFNTTEQYMMYASITAKRIFFLK